MLNFLNRHISSLKRSVNFVRRPITIKHNNHFVSFFISESSSTNGVRFWSRIYKRFKDCSLTSQRPTVVYCNVDVSPLSLLVFRFFRIPVILRIDGLIYERPSLNFFLRLPILLRFPFLVFSLPYFIGIDKNAIFFVKFFSNFSITLKIFFSSYIIFQSEFSKNIFSYIYNIKNSSVVLNGGISHTLNETPISSLPITFSTIVPSGSRCSKRVSSIIEFYLFIKSRIDCRLVLLGLDLLSPPDDLSNFISIIQNDSNIHVVPPFSLTDYSQEYIHWMLNSHFYISFAFRDPCPNAIVESLEFNLPIFGVSGGGVPELVGDQSTLLCVDEFETGFLSSHFDNSLYPILDFNKLFDILSYSITHYSKIKRSSLCYFNSNLDLDISFHRYLAASSNVK